MLGVHEKMQQDGLWGVCWSSPGSSTASVSHRTSTQLFSATVLCIRKPTKAVLVFTALKPQLMPSPPSHQLGTTALISFPPTTHPQQVPLEASAGSGPKTSSQTLSNCKFCMVSSQNQESDQICLKKAPVSVKPCYKLQQSLSFDFLVKLETTCVQHGLGFCCEYLTRLYGNSLFLWAFSISYPSQNHKKQRLENMKTTIMWKKGGLKFLNLRQHLCSFRVQSEVLN